MRDEAYIYDLFPLDHSPLPPYPRTGDMYERIFSSLWKSFMHKEVHQNDPRESNFAGVMTNYGYRISQRSASVVASIVCWFGTNCGGAFLREADALGEELSSRKKDSRYLLQWTLENARLTYLNSGQRILELCTSRTGKEFDLLLEDYEAVECLMVWLATGEGQLFLSLANEMVTEESARQRIKRRAEWEVEVAAWKEKQEAHRA
jgi:hypothetical protein